MPVVGRLRIGSLGTIFLFALSRIPRMGVSTPQALGSRVG
jgi:hypothetical protein